MHSRAIILIIIKEKWQLLNVICKWQNNFYTIKPLLFSKENEDDAEGEEEEVADWGEVEWRLETQDVRTLPMQRNKVIFMALKRVLLLVGNWDVHQICITYIYTIYEY